jgi:phosphatidylglycerol---prolipoprotein diacylglyceryl transferase
MHPILFQVGPFEIRSYGVMLAVSFVVGTWLARRRARAAGLGRLLGMELYLFIAVASLVGSRLQFIAENLSRYSLDRADALRTWQGGLSMQFGVILAILVVAVYVRHVGAPFAQTADLLAPSVALGECLTRIGCFMNGCCFGGACSLPWGVVFSRASQAGAQFPGIPIHPTQLYLSLSSLAVFGALLSLEGRRRGHGYLFGWFLILSSTARFLVDFIRSYESSSVVFTVGPLAINHYQVISAALFVVGLYFLWRAGPLRAQT